MIRLKQNLPVFGIPNPVPADPGLTASEARCRPKYKNVTIAPNRCSVRAVSAPPMKLEQRFGPVRVVKLQRHAR